MTQTESKSGIRSIKEGDAEDDDVATAGGSRKPLVLAKTGERLLRVPGCGLIFGDAISTAPPVLVHMVSNLAAVYETVVLVTVRSAPLQHLHVINPPHIYQDDDLPCRPPNMPSQADACLARQGMSGSIQAIFCAGR